MIERTDLQTLLTSWLYNGEYIPGQSDYERGKADGLLRAAEELEQLLSDSAPSGAKYRSMSDAL